jgi:hypothetical protein
MERTMGQSADQAAKKWDIAISFPIHDVGTAQALFEKRRAS